MRGTTPQFRGFRQSVMHLFIKCCVSPRCAYRSLHRQACQCPPAFLSHESSSSTPIDVARIVAAPAPEFTARGAHAGAMRRTAALCLPFAVLCLIIATNLKTVCSDSAHAMRRRSRIRKQLLRDARRTMTNQSKPGSDWCALKRWFFLAASSTHFRIARTRSSQHADASGSARSAVRM